MAQSPYVFEVQASTFRPAVIENSKRVPVMVDFWAAWCAPCQVLMPILAKLADEYRGKFLLAKVNTDEQQELAREYGIRSLPTVKLFKDGQVAQEFLGAQPESYIRKMLERHILRESDQMRTVARAAIERGDVNEAMSLLHKASEIDPDNFKVRVDLASILFEQGSYPQVDALLKTLPAEARDEPGVRRLQSLLEFAGVMQEAPDPARLEAEVLASPRNSEARYQLSARKVLQGDYAAALEHLLHIVRSDPNLRDRARKAMVSVFNLLGGTGELVNRYRTLMFNALH